MIKLRNQDILSSIFLVLFMLEKQLEQNRINKIPKETIFTIKPLN